MSARSRVLPRYRVTINGIPSYSGPELGAALAEKRAREQHPTARVEKFAIDSKGNRT